MAKLVYNSHDLFLWFINVYGRYTIVTVVGYKPTPNW